MSAALWQLVATMSLGTGVVAHLLRPMSVSLALGWGAVVGFVLLCALGTVGWAPLAPVLNGALLVAGVGLYFSAPRATKPLGHASGRYTGGLILLLCLLVLGLAYAEASLRPLYAWDAWFAWWVDAELDRAQELGPRVSLDQWQHGADAHYHPIAHYPPLLRAFPSVLALSSPAPLGALAALGWMWIALACLLLLYSQLRQSGVDLRGAALAALVLVTTPLWINHLVLPGQMDLPLSWLWSALLLAVVQARTDGRYRWLASGLALAIALSKLEALIYLAALALALLPRCWRGWLGMGLIAALAALALWSSLASEPLRVVLSGIDLRIAAAWVLPTLMRDLFAGSFGLIPLLVLVSIPQLARRAAVDPAFAVLLRALVHVQIGLLALFSFTGAADYVEAGTVYSRLLLHSLPAWIYMLAVAHFSSSSAPASQVDKAGDTSSPGAPSAQPSAS